MSQDNNTEQKSLPATDKKLRDARKKGRVSSSRDLISGAGLLAMLIYFLMTWTTIRDKIHALLDLIPQLYLEPFGTAWRRAIAIAGQLVWDATAPAVAVLVLVSVVTGMIGTFGPVFSFEPVKPNFEHINPAAGLKRLFSVRNVTEFAKSVFKVVLLGSVLFLVLRYWLQAMFHAPNCGEACVAPLLIAAAKPILAVAALAFITIGASDIALQRWLFLRDMRMTRTELKRERKDLEGDPLILSARKRERQRQGRTPRLGLGAANLMIAGGGHIAGVRYHRKDAPVPVVVTKSSGTAVAAMRQASADLNIPIIEEPELAVALAVQHRPGDYIHQRHFPVVAKILISQKLV
ncbi:MULTISPECIES: EscU/YscU/HrcU family type III secretion system export apparatus switch protein [Rhodomicrobium]|uniref:EscU/YscU/HrcU family type III secretion system export apparatus switch protein n=1 Tax=Rhodomicrobium TaxID=1068 RepID=UPI0014833F43|nr:MULTISPECIES: EscU/YscU/HrcU family type III secretion system export apparatus switch protein [Rhodomicrobium]